MEISKIKQIPKYSIRNLGSESDFHELTKIFSQFDIPNFFHGLKRNHLCLVAKADQGGEILGGVVFMIQEHHAFVISVAVNKQYQRNRIGSSLMRIVEEIVIFDVNRIEVIAPKDERKNFYLFLGYKQYRENYMDKWLSFFKRFHCSIKKALNLKMAPSGVPYQL
ncbi:MAG: GNAT family N-acetyltransferase [Candidatus Hodarchaeota archaeon]